MAGKNLFKVDSKDKQKKYLKATIVFIVALFIGFFIYLSISMIVNHDKTATIEVLVGPTDATLEIDGRIFPTETTIRIKPGTYAIKIEKEGFVSYNGSIKANANETSYLYEYLAETDENGTFYKNNERELARIQQISDKRADIFHEQYNGTDPIWNVTPYDDYSSGYKIYAEKDENGKIIINVYLYTCSSSRFEKLKQNALDYFEEKKIDLNNYTIKYSSCS